MGIAAYNRGNALISSQFRAEIEASNATLDARASLWRRAMELGLVLQFKGPGGDVVTCGPHQTAVGPAGFQMIRYGSSRWAGTFEASRAWSVALEVVRHVGRKRPFRISGDAEVEAAA